MSEGTIIRLGLLYSSAIWVNTGRFGSSDDLSIPVGEVDRYLLLRA